MRLAGVLIAAAIAVWILWGATSGDATHAPEQQAPRSDRDAVRVVSPDSTSRAPILGSVSARPPSFVRYVVRDAESKSPLNGVVVFDARVRARVGETDANGVVDLDGLEPDRLIFISQQHVSPLNLFATDDAFRMQRELEERALVDVFLHRDTQSLVRELRFVDRDGRPAVDVAFELPPIETFAKQPSDAAWRSFRLASGYVPTDLLPVCFAEARGVKSFGVDAAGAARIRFAFEGRYRCVGSSSNGLAFYQEFEVTASDSSPIRMVARQDLSATGIVLDRDGQPISAARIRVRNSGLSACTNRDGRFSIGPLTEAVSINVTALGFATIERRRVAAGSQPIRVVLDRLPDREVVVRVRSAANGLPVGSANVVCTCDGSEPERRQTSSDGAVRFATPAARMRVAVDAKHHLTYRTWIDERNVELLVELVPESRQARVAARISGLIIGRVRDARDAPAAGVRVFAESLRPSNSDPVDVDRGIPRHEFVVTDASGRFVFESTEAGDFRVFAERDSNPDGSIVSVALGLTSAETMLHVKP